MADDHVTRRFFDLYASDAARDWALMERLYVEALCVQAGYQRVIQSAMDRIVMLEAENASLRRRLRQIMGLEQWSGESPDAEIDGR